MRVRCLACGEVFEYHPSHPMCPRRYMSPHDEDFLDAVARNLEAAGAARSDASVEQHKAAVKAALKARNETTP